MNPGILAIARIAAAITALTLLALGLEANASEAASFKSSNPWRCSVHLLPDFVDSTSNPNENKQGTSYLYVGARQMTNDYRAEATFTLPRTGQSRGFYGNSIRLGPLRENYAFVQVMLIRWKRFNFSQHIAIAWAYPEGIVQLKDTDLAYPDRHSSHRLGIGVAGRLLSLYVDGSAICTASSDHFVRPNAAKYFQIRTETNQVGFAGSGTVRVVKLKRDSDVSPKLYESHCEFHGYGVSWVPLGGGAFRVAGAFYPNEATYFSGITPDSKCTGIAR